MKVSAEEARSLGRIMDTLDLVLQHRPDLPGALIGNDALVLCFIPNRTNPSPHYVNWFGLAGQAAKQQRWSYIQAVRPLLFFHKASWGEVNVFYRRAHYVPSLYVDEESLEIAVPQELADAMGVTVYGAALDRGKASETARP